MTHRGTLVERVRDEISGWPIGSGYYGTKVATDEAAEMAVAAVDAALPWHEPLCLGCGAGETECLELGGCCNGCDHR